ncbi:hypothetical protein F4805DRAFT_376353 [Annulohypoxylon moriforme]|nr:hypothetical protein F4805DRAFT_376353 [Annulohypoxylon moriforme]
MVNNTDNRYFSGKCELIHTRIGNFLKDEDAKADANAYFNSREPKYGKGKTNWIKAVTPFTGAEHKGGITKLAVGENVLLIGNRESFSEGQYPDEPQKAGMSMVHIFAIPKANYFNPVSMKPEDAHIINDMIDFFYDQWGRIEFREAVLEHQKKAIEARGGKKLEDLVQEKEQYEELEEIIRILHADEFAFGFHLWPDNSIEHLHMHIIAMPDDCRQYSTKLNDEKTVDAFEVYDEVKRQL